MIKKMPNKLCLNIEKCIDTLTKLNWFAANVTNWFVANDIAQLAVVPWISTSLLSPSKFYKIFWCNENQISCCDGSRSKSLATLIDAASSSFNVLKTLDTFLEVWHITNYIWRIIKESLAPAEVELWVRKIFLC